MTRQVKNQVKPWTAMLLAGCMMLTILFGHSYVAEAASKFSGKLQQTVLDAEQVGSDIYLSQAMTLNDHESFVGIFANPQDYSYYFGTSEDLVNWELVSRHFSLTYGNGIFAGISRDGEYKTQLQYTKGGSEWFSLPLPEGIEPLSVKFENGYFKMIARDQDGKTVMAYSKDAEHWIDLTNDVPQGANAENFLIKDDKIFIMVGTSVSGNSVRIYEAAISEINEEDTQWTEVKAPKESVGSDLYSIDDFKENGYGITSNFFFDGKNVGVELYSIEAYNATGYVSEKLYFISEDFIHWDSKEWSREYYSPYDATSTEQKDVTVSSQRLEAIENLQYDQPSYRTVSSVIYSEDGEAWSKDLVNIFVDGKQVNEKPVGKAYAEELKGFEWAREGVEYALGRGFIGQWSVFPLDNNMTRGDYLELLMRALDLQEPSKPVSTYVPFVDVYSGSLIERANRLGLVNGVGQNQFAPYDYISRQDLMTMTYNILSKLGKITPDTSLASLKQYKDSDKVKDYAQIPVSSLTKAGIIEGDGVNVNPLSNISNAEALKIAFTLDQYRDR